MERPKIMSKQQHTSEFTVETMYRFTKVFRGAYYDGLHRVPTTAEKDYVDLTGIL